MYILEVSYGCPSEKYPLNGIFQMDQAKALADLGHKVVFAAVDIRSIRRWRKWGISQRTANSLPVVEFNFPMGPFFPKLSRRICRRGFSKVLKKVIRQYGKPDVVHVHFGGTALCVVEACKRENIPYIVTEHSSIINRDDLTEAEIAPMRYVYQNAAAVIAVSSALARHIKQYSSISAAVIPNIVDLSAFDWHRKKHDEFRFIAAANLNQGKGFDILLKAFHKCREIGMDATLTIMGDGPEMEALINTVSKYHLGDVVSFYGRYVRTQFAEELSQSDAFVLASRGETFGVVYAEAMACGVPVIATRCGGPEDFVDDSNGILVDVDDVDGLADAMMTMYYHAGEYDSAQIAERTQERFSAEKVARQVTDILMFKDF